MLQGIPDRGEKTDKCRILHPPLISKLSEQGSKMAMWPKLTHPAEDFSLRG